MGRAVVATALLGLPLSGLHPTDALAGLGAQAAATSSASSASWGAVATTAAAAPYGTGPLVLSFAKAAKAPPQYVNLVNTGSAPLSEAAYALTAQPALEVVLEACTGSWDERRGTCTGTVLVLATSGTPAVSTTVPARPGDLLRVRVRLTASRTPAMTVTLDVRASNSNLG